MSIERYNFTDLIRRHSVPFEVVSYTKGSYIGGHYQKGTEGVVQRFGAILPMTDNKIYQSGGTYSTKDRMLYISNPIEGKFDTLKVRYDGSLYSIEAAQEFTDYSDAYIYTLKWVEPVSGSEVV